MSFFSPNRPNRQGRQSSFLGSSSARSRGTVSFLALAALVAALVGVASAVAGGGNSPTCIATPGADRITLTPQDDDCDALPGDDRVEALGGSDRIEGNAGNDRLDGGDGNDSLLDTN